MEKKNVISQIVNTIRDAFEQDGFKLKAPNKFEKKRGDSLYIYEICVTKSKTYFSLHLRLKLQNKSISTDVNNILKKVLKDPIIKYPTNFTDKVIDGIVKGRTTNNDVYGLTDWRFFKGDEQTLNDLMLNSLFGFLILRNWRKRIIGRQNYYKVWIMQRAGLHWLIMMHI